MRDFTHRVLNSLWGLHIGDSLGATIEFEAPKSRGYFHTEILGKGPFNWDPGDPTDDTQLMILLLESISEVPSFSQENYSKKLIAWMDSKPADIGTTTIASIRRLKEGIPFHLAGVRGEENQSNGSLMRCAALAAFYQGTKLFDNAKLQAELTHAHPKCILADQFYLGLLRQVLENPEKSRETLVNERLLWLKAQDLVFYEKLAFEANAEWESLESTGSIFNTLRIVLWAYLRYSDFEESLLWAINRGGDSDTVGAILGALAGASADILPPRWLNSIKKRSKIEDLVTKILTTK